jgi:MFS family permease
VRTRLIALGLAVWSLMTSASAFARNFAELSGARIGVGIGEASANPSAYSLLSDYFPPARRATVLAIYSSGIHIGAGLGLGIGGLIVQRWDAAFAGAVPLARPARLAGRVSRGQPAGSVARPLGGDPARAAT